MEFSSSQSTEYFDAPEQPDENRGFGSSASISPTRSEDANRLESVSPTPRNQLPFMRLLPPPTDQSYPTIDALLADVNKTSFRQGYHVVRRGGDKKDKDGNLRKSRLNCSKGGGYKDEGRAKQGGRARRRQRTDCPWKAYASMKEGEWYIRVEEAEHNHPAVAPEAFAANRKFSQADIAVIKDDKNANIRPIKTLARLHNLNPGKYFTLRDLYNQRAQLRREKLARLTPVQRLLQELRTSDQWFTTHQLDGCEQLTHLFFAFKPSLYLLEMYPDVLFIDCTYKINKYDIPLCIFSGVTGCNKSFYIGFAFLRYEDIESYHWVVSQVKELYSRVGQAAGPDVVLTDKEDALIAALQEVMPGSYHMLCIWHINKNVLGRATKFFPTLEQVEAWMDLWYKVCQAPTLAEYEQARGELQIADPPRIPDHRNSLFESVDKEYLCSGNNQKHCYYWTNCITHFNKRVISTAEEGHANIKRALESTLGDLPEVVAAIKENVEDQLRKIHLQHTQDKNGNIKASLNIGMFRYLRHEISEYALDLMATHALGVNADSVLVPCTGVFTKTLGLPCKHMIQDTFRHPDRPLLREDLHPHWWLNPLGDNQPVEPWARIQPPVRTRRRGRPRNPRREPSAF